MSLDILIPCKRLHEGKTRLASVLPPDKRSMLCREFLERTLAVSNAVAAADRIAVVSEDAAALEYARRVGALAIRDPGRGLNAALDHGNRELLRTGGAHDLLILPTDLPIMSAASLQAMSTTTLDVLIAPDSRDDGTNVLFLRSAARRVLPFSYGAFSARRHLEQARSLGLTAALYHHAELMLDIDTAQDLKAWRGDDVPLADQAAR